MPAVDAIIQYGEISDLRMIDEPDILVQSLVITPARDKKTWLGPNLAVRALRYTNPILTFKFNGIISEAKDLANQHPGTLVDELANFTGNIYQFDPDTGILVYEDPSRNYSLENPAETDFSVVQFPFIGNSSDTWIPDAEPA